MSVNIQRHAAMKNILIIGSSGHAKNIIEIIELCGQQKIVGLIDSFRDIGEKTLNYEVLGSIEDIPRLAIKHNCTGLFIAVGDNFSRYKIESTLRGAAPALEYITAIHPSANVSASATIGTGTVIMAGASIGASAVVGTQCILNTNSSLDHDSTMQHYSSLAPNAATGGNCNIGDYSAIGIGATIVHGVNIGKHTVIGAGATVLNDIDDLCVAYGTPAMKIRTRNPGDKYL